MSDHADWNGLVSAIDATDCECVYLTHGYTASFTRYLNEIGFNAREVHTLYGGEEEDAPLPETPKEIALEEAIDKAATDTDQASPTVGDLVGAANKGGATS
jgi:putative mRNA 3-end processing factor